MAAKKKRVDVAADYGNAQSDEAQARGSHYPDAIHEDTGAAREAKAKAVKAADELYAIDEETRLGDEKKVTLVGPNPKANITDSNGVKFVDGKAEDVPESLAERYTKDFEGYSVQSGGGKSS